MKDTQLYSQILGIQKPWKVTSVNVSLEDDEVEVQLQHGGGKLTCPKCGQACPGYDKRPRRWRHLDTCQLKTVLVADVPRVECQEQASSPLRCAGQSPAVASRRCLKLW